MGSEIISCVPVKSKRSIVSDYVIYSGTSMAALHVTGVVALYQTIQALKHSR